MSKDSVHVNLRADECTPTVNCDQFRAFIRFEKMKITISEKIYFIPH